MNAVDRFSNTLARYRQQSTLPPMQPVQSVQQPPVQLPPVQQPARPSDVERAVNKVAEVTPILSRLAALLTRVQNPAPAATAPASYPATYPATYPGTPPLVAPTGAVGQSLQRLGQAVGSKDVDTFVRTAAPVLDEALPLIDDIVNLVGGKSRQPAQVGIASTQAPSGSVSSLGQQVAPVMDGVTSLVTGVGSLVKAFEGLFKR